MTEHRDDHAATEAQRARVEALRQRRPPRVDATVTPAATSDRPRARRRHPAGRSRVGAAAFSVATMLGLVGVMGLARPASSAPPTAPVTATQPATTPAPAPAATDAGAAPPVTLTARPRVHVTTPTTAAPAARTNGSH